MRRLWIFLALAACSESEALTDATSLDCPAPGALPFRLASHGYQNAVNRTIADERPRIKDEASDTLGNPGGAVASIYLGDDTATSAAPVSYRGAKARTPANTGLVSTPVPGEFVSLWFFDTAAADWRSVGRGMTGLDGGYEFPDTGFVAPNGEPLYAMLEGDASCAVHFDTLLAPGSKVVVADIDGTLTLSDEELVLQLVDDDYVPRMMGAADRLTRAWADKGYPIIYLTARPHLFRAESRGWLDDLQFASGALITAAGGEEAAAYKTVWMRRLMVDFGWDVIAAYGNADTDITAYKDGGVPDGQIFIVGDLAGTRGTQPIANLDFAAHIADFVAPFPANTP